MRACPNCGQLIPESANFCHMCGERMPAELPPPRPAPVLEEPSRLPRVLRWVVAAGSAVVLALVAAALVLNNPDEQADPTSDGSGSVTDGAVVVASPPSPQSLLAATSTVQLQVRVANCEKCVITAVPADGTARKSGSVANGSVELTLDSRSTLGLGLTISHPQGFGEAGGPNVAVLAPLGAVPGGSVAAATIANATSVGICWAGTLATTATIGLKVEPHGDRTPTGGLRVWADPAQPVLDAMVAPSGDGTVEQPALSTCSNEFRLLGG